MTSHIRFHNDRMPNSDVDAPFIIFLELDIASIFVPAFDFRGGAAHPPFPLWVSFDFSSTAGEFAESASVGGCFVLIATVGVATAVRFRVLGGDPVEHEDGKDSCENCVRFCFLLDEKIMGTHYLRYNT
jgi:hypothetical protein